MIDTKHTNPDSHIMELLPWYVNDSLSESEKAEVDAYLVSHPEYLQEIELLRTIQNTTEENIDIPVPNRDRLMQKLDEIEQIDEHSFSQYINQLLAWLFSPRAAWTAIPVALALAVVMLWTPSQTSLNGDFHTLSSGDTTATLTISITTSSTDDASTVIDQMHKLVPAAKIKTKYDNQFVIFLSDKVEPEETIKLLKNLQSLPGVKSAEIVTTR